MSFHRYAAAMLLSILVGTATAHQHGKPDDPAARVTPAAREKPEYPHLIRRR
jgi:hypothetical protein